MIRLKEYRFQQLPGVMKSEDFIEPVPLLIEVGFRPKLADIDRRSSDNQSLPLTDP